MKELQCFSIQWAECRIFLQISLHLLRQEQQLHDRWMAWTSVCGLKCFWLHFWNLLLLITQKKSRMSHKQRGSKFIQLFAASELITEFISLTSQRWQQERSLCLFSVVICNIACNILTWLEKNKWQKKHSDYNSRSFLHCFKLLFVKCVTCGKCQ